MGSVSGRDLVAGRNIVLAGPGANVTIYEGAASISGKSLLEPLYSDPELPPPLPPPNQSQKVSEVALLPEIDYRPFDITLLETVVDLRSWLPYDAKAVGQKTSPVTTTRRLVALKKQPVDYIRIYGATVGSGIDLNCLSGQAFWIEYAEATGRPRVNLMKEYHLVVDISAVPTGSRFEVIARMTAWNGMQEDDAWQAFVAFAPIPQFNALLLFPKNRPYKSRKFVTYPPGVETEQPAEGRFKQLERPLHDRLYWEIKPMVKGTTYEVQWEW